MTDSGDQRQENQALRERISTLTAAILRISATLDLDTVLAEVVDTAPAGLPAPRYGIIVTVDEAGAPADFVFCGITRDEAAGPVRLARQASACSQHLRELPGPSAGSRPARPTSARSAWRPRGPSRGPSRARRCATSGADVGSFFLGDKADGEAFTDDDEEVLVLFASQAAAAIANARTYRGERQARADLAALAETTPVGVVIFDAASGRLGVAQPRGKTDRREPADAGPSVSSSSWR